LTRWNYQVQTAEAASALPVKLRALSMTRTKPRTLEDEGGHEG